MSDRTSRYGAFRSRRDGGDEYAKSRDAERGNRREKENVFLLLEVKSLSVLLHIERSV
mgnify:FL=1